ncbi:DUF3800 domain-containing protein [Bacillus sp. OVS6]|nr:DUF3800 domain-containing protein [Bacillus sp. OVS6]
MMSDWRERPTVIDYLDESIQSFLSIDENGTTDLAGVRKNILPILTQNDHPDRWFTISGVAIDRNDYMHFKDLISTVKFKHWNQGCYDYKQGNKRVVFHSRDIRKRIGPFNPKLINYPELMEDVSNVVEKTNFKVYSASIDKAMHITKYNTPYPVYDLCLEFILERYCRSLNGKKGIILLESRGKKEDAVILRYLKGLLDNGNRYWDKSAFECISGVYFNPKWSRHHENKMSFISLELADLVSYPIHKYVKLGVKDKAYEVIEEKISNYPNINGYGLKVFP